MNKKTVKVIILRFVQGLVMGGGAILPGVSGGVLCAAFGLYMPLMKLLSHPKREVPKQWRLWLNVGIGWLCGFVLFALGVMRLLDFAESAAMALFAGLIVGTLPALWREAHEDPSGISPKDPSGIRKTVRFCICGLSFVLSMTFFVLISKADGVNVLASINDYARFGLCGVILGLGMIVPGLTSSSLLMMLGLYEPMTDGIAAFDMGVLLPVGVGLAVAFVLTSKLVNFVFSKLYTEAYFAVMGIVLSSTLMIIPFKFVSWSEFLLCAVLFSTGIAASFFGERMLGNEDGKDRL